MTTDLEPDDNPLFESFNPDGYEPTLTPTQRYLSRCPHLDDCVPECSCGRDELLEIFESVYPMGVTPHKEEKN